MNQIGAVLNFGFGLLLCWVLYYFGWRLYRIDKVRNDLFELRNELFLFAADGHISFNDPAYFSLRRRIEALIRFAHTLCFTRSLIFGILQSRFPIPELEERYRYWSAALERLPAESRKKLQDIHKRVQLAIIKQMLLNSPALFFVAFVAWTFDFLKSLVITQESKEEGHEERVVIFARNELRVELIEEQAVLAQQEEELVLAAT